MRIDDDELALGEDDGGGEVGEGDGLLEAGEVLDAAAVVADAVGELGVGCLLYTSDAADD